MRMRRRMLGRSVARGRAAAEGVGKNVRRRILCAGRVLVYMKNTDGAHRRASAKESTRCEPSPV